MESIQVVNIKCGGCKSKIRSSLIKAGITSIAIDIPTQTVSFEGDRDTASAELLKLGYPEAGSEDAKSLLKKGHSFVSCAIGKITKNR